MESVKTLQSHQVQYNNSADTCIPCIVPEVILLQTIL